MSLAHQRLADRVLGSEGDGWITLGGTLQVSPGPPWTPGQAVDVSITLENFTGENFCTQRAITAERLVQGVFDVCAGRGGTRTPTETITIPDFPEQQFTQVTISVEGTSQSVTGSIETAAEPADIEVSTIDIRVV